MKILVIYPGKNTNFDSPFYIFDPDTGECLAIHFCSGAYYAKSDLHDSRPERLQEWEKQFGQKTEAKFIDETSYNWDEIYNKNQALKTEN